MADSNRIDLAFGDDGCELVVRIGARPEADSFIGSVWVLMSHVRCTLSSPKLDDVVPTDVPSVKSALLRSQARRCALDAQAFLVGKASS